MNDKNSVGISAGSISILAIFVVLCLTTLATLSLVTARADYVLTQKTAESVDEYYAADGKAEEELERLVQTLEISGMEGLEGQTEYTVLSGGGTARVQYTVEINDIKDIFVEVELSLDGDGEYNGEWRVTRWQTVIREESVDAEPGLNVLR